ncbi:hypothetical protein BGZ63DRAFT_95612 [Mariannaea sp. PMI_226]|nr:hypothetical protein BGZ63DRAFT_95612 [Mariannaea sp. PMI_226]
MTVSRYPSQRKNPWLLQVCLAATKDTESVVLPEQVDQDRRMSDKCLFVANLQNVISRYGQVSWIAKVCNPHPAVLPVQFLKNVELFHEAVALALDNIVERWWKDEEANFPGRMPIEPRAEALLRWVDDNTDKGIIPPYKGRHGNMRPDILIPAGDEDEIPRFKICEINGRFPNNYLHFAGCAFEAQAGMTWHRPLLQPATTHDAVYDSIFRLFNPSSPIHFVVESLDLSRENALFGYIEHRTGFWPRFVSPSSLRVLPCDSSPTGFDLYCVWGTDPKVTDRPKSLVKINGEVLESVCQVGLQLLDFELLSLAPDLVRHIAMRCVNDPRTVFLSFDKRMLGIIRQELGPLVDKHHVLTPKQAEILKEGIMPTILPGSPELKLCLEIALANPGAKDAFILKPYRLARGQGVVLGKDVSALEWCSLLESMQAVDFDCPKSQCLLQPLLPQRIVDLFWDEERGVRSSRMVGSYFAVNGQFVGLGGWKAGLASEDIITASTKEVTTLSSVIFLGDSKD